MPDRDEREEAFGASKDTPELVDGVVGVAALEGPNHPRVERVVASPVGDVRDARQELAVERDTGRLHTEVVEASDRLGWLHPRDCLEWCSHLRSALLEHVRAVPGQVRAM